MTKFGQVSTCPNLAVFGRLSPERNLTIFNLVGCDQKLPYSVKSVPTDEFSGVNPDRNLTDQDLTQMWPYLAKLALAKIWSY